MAETRDDMQRDLARKREERELEAQAIADALALLEKVDGQRREHPEDRRRWDRRADSLERLLEESRRRLNWLDLAIKDLEKKVAGVIQVEEESGALVVDPGANRATPPDIDLTLAKRRHESAERVLNAPVFKLDEVSLEDFALAKAFLDSPEAKSFARDRREELRRRIGIYDRRSERQRLGKRSTPTVDERRQQALLRNVLEKCRAGTYPSVTLGEIDLLINSYALIVQHPEIFGDRDRLFGLIDNAVDAVCERWAQLRRLQSDLASDAKASEDAHS